MPRVGNTVLGALGGSSGACDGLQTPSITVSTIARSATIAAWAPREILP